MTRGVRNTAAGLVFVLGLTMVAMSVETAGRSSVLDCNFGTVRSGTVLEHTFLVRNLSFRPARIEHVRTSCSCTTPEYTTEAVLPFRLFRIKALFGTGGAGGEKQSSLIVDFSNGRRIQLRMLADIQVDYPKSIDFGRVRVSDATEKRFRLRWLIGRRYEISRIDYDERRLEASWSPVPDEGYEIKVRLKPEVAYGPFTASLSILTDDTSEPQKWVVASGYVLNHVELEGGEVPLGIVQRGDTVQRSAFLASTYGLPFAVTEVVSSSSEIRASPDDNQFALRHRLLVEVRPEDGTQYLESRLLVRCVLDGSSEPLTVEVPVYGILSDRTAY